MQKEQMKNPMKKSTRTAEWLVACFFSAIAFALLVTLHVPKFAVVVSGSSMYPTFCEGEKVDVSKVTKSTELCRFDVVIARVDGRQLIKRLVGLPNEKIEAKSGTIFINGKELKEYEELAFGKLTSDFSVEMGADEYFLIGDNLEHSGDSRDFGPIKRSNLLYKVH